MGCPVPGCTKDVPSKSTFCPDHYFRLPTAYTRLINRVSFQAARTESESERQYLEEQRQGYIGVCVRTIQSQGPRP